ncbi:MAG: hypothetical protein NT067_01215 [Candidatus Diapherotrites archaeon]|nr:hypothetical protein [Candidatus Diapherotrites archaeon]
MDPKAPNYVKASCALGLGEFKTEEAGDFLQGIAKLARNPHLVQAALEGIGNTGITKYGPFLVSQLGHPTERGRIGAIRGICLLGYKPGVEGVLDLMNDKAQSLWVFRECAFALGKIADEKILNSDRAFEKPYEVLKSTDEKIARTGFTALMFLGSKRTFVPLLVTMFRPHFAEDARYAMGLLLQSKPDAVARDLGEIFKKTKMPEIKAAVCSVLIMEEAPWQMDPGLKSVLGGQGISWHPGFGSPPGALFILDLLKRKPELEQEFEKAIDAGLARLGNQK